jgi:formylglycine-generating enzyme required for sulfatase activity/serine/threonine protein kinase/WD40 repeat protein
MPVDICPSDSDWELWSGGLVADSQSTEFEAHLHSCESCLDRVRNARVDDQLLQAAHLLAKGELFTPGEQMSITKLVEQIKLRRGDSSDGDPDTGTLPRSEETIVGEFAAPSEASAEVTAGHPPGGDSAGSVGLEPVSQAEKVQRGPRDHYTQRDESLATPTEHELVPGLQLGAYRLVKKLGQGGMGLVFLAEHQRMKRLVALKVLPPSVTRYPTAVQRFQREVHALARLSHPNIVTAHDADEARGLHFLVMEYVDGQDLMALVKKRGPLPVGQAIDYVAQGALGLEYAHKRGLVHRDIKPSNLLVDTEGQVKLLDLGLARFSEQADDPDGQGLDLTGTGVVVGTVDYMSPEQAENTKTVDARADIYSLGCTLYFLLTGKKVYTGETVIARLMAHQTQSIPSLRSINPSLPEALDRVYQKMVAKNREERYQTVTEVLADLGKLAPAYAGISATRFVPDVSHAALNEQHFPGGPAVAVGAESAVTTPDTQPLGLPPRNRWWLKIAAAGAFAAALLFGVSIVLKDKEGREIARIPVEPGQSVTVQPAPGTTVSVEHGPDNQAKVQATNSAGWQGWPSDAPKPAIAPFDGNQARRHQEEWAAYLKVPVEYSNSIGMKFRLIPPGEFQMGATKEQSEVGLEWINAANLKAEAFERSRIKEEGPQHVVTLSQPYCVGATEVTVAQFRAFVEASKYLTQGERFGSGDSSSWNPNPNVNPEQVSVTWRTPGCPATDDHPVTQVTWADAVAFCNWLSEQEALFPCYRKNDNDEWERIADGAGYRLPTEAEWEYACRAGTVTQFSFGDDPALLKTHGWSGADGLGAPSLVAQKQPNPFGLFDMHGNLREWCQDWYSSEYYAESSPVDPAGPEFGSDRVMRGGRWSDHSVSCRSAFRSDISPFLRNRVGGFRVVRVAPLPPSATDLLLSSDHTWSEPENLGPELNSKLDDTGPSSSSDGLSLLFASKRPLGHVGFELWESRRESLNDPFGPPTEFPRIVNSNGDDDSPHLSVDGRQLLFASNRPGSKGDRDLYICHRGDRAAKWSAPKSLGTAINTDAREDRPFLTPDGLTLYFCSNRPGGEGQLDVWRAVRPSIDGDFGEPTNLGPNVNTPQDELSFTVLSDGRSAVMLRLNGDQTSVVLIPVKPHGGGFGSPRVLELGEAGKSIRGMSFSPDETVVYCHATRPEGHGAADLWRIRRIPKPGRPDRNLGWHGWPADAPQPAIAPFDAEQAKRHQEEWAAYLKVPVEYTNTIGMKFRLIPPGEFLMGGSEAEIEAALDRDDNRKVKTMLGSLRSQGPRHRVILTQPIYLGVNEVSQSEYEQVLGSNPSHFASTGKGKESVAGLETTTHPVDMVSWLDALDFCSQLSQREHLKPFYFRVGEVVTPLEGTGYRLPSEAEWEFACRAGTITKYWIGDKDDDLVQAGWFGGNSGIRTHAAGELKSNPFGLADVCGNVWEWVQDAWDEGWYARFKDEPAVNPIRWPAIGEPIGMRGGTHDGPALFNGSSFRTGFYRTETHFDAGFRVSLTVDAVKSALVSHASPAAKSKTPWHDWPAGAPLPAIAPFDAAQAKKHQEEWAAYLQQPVEFTNAIGMKFRLIPPGEFLMGGPDSDPLAKPVEKPQHKVTITKPFYLAVHELTREQFSKFVAATKYATDAERSGQGALSVDLATGKPKRDPMVNWRSPGFPQLPSHPVVNITWNDAVAFCAWQGENRYRLPTEAEWEYACRAGTRTPYHMGDDAAQLVEFGNVQDAAYKDVFGPGEFNVSVRDGYVFTAPVGSFRPNPFGLYDVIGNVWEWCADSGMRGYSSTASVDPMERQQVDLRMSRGGALECWATHSRSSVRNYSPKDLAAANQGVRLALSIDLSRLNPNAEPPPATGEDQTRSPAQTPLDTTLPQPLGTWKAGPAAAWLEGDYRHDGPVLGGLIDTPRTIPGVKRWNVDTAWPRGQIQDIRHSPDGKWVALGCEDGHVRILDAVTLKPTRLLPGVGPGGVLYIALDWHPDNDRIVVSSNRTVRILSRTGGPSRSFAVSATISPFAVAWNKAGTRLAIGGINTPTAIEVRTTEGELISQVADLADQPLGTITSLAWSEDDTQLWAYGSRGRCAGYQAQSGQELWSFATKADPVPSGIRSRFSRDGWFACGDLNEVHLYNPDRKLVHTLPTVGVGIAWHPEGRRLFAGTSQWDRDTGRKLVEGENGFPAVSWSPDGSRFLGAEQLSLREHNERGEPTGREVVSIRGWLPLRDLRWSPDGQRVAVDCYNIGPHARELIFDESGRECPVHPAFEGRTLLAWSPDGTTAYAWGRDSSLPDSRNALWVIDRDGSARPVWTPAESDLAPSDLKTLSGAVSADGRFLALAVPGGVQVLDEHHKPIRQIMTGGKAVPLVAWNPVSQQLTILVDGEPLRFVTPTRGWEVETRGEPIAGLADIRAPRWSPDGQWLSVNRIGRLGLSGKPHPDNALVLRVASWRADSEELIDAGDFVSHFDLFAASSKPTRVRHINGGVVSADWNPRGHLIATCQYQSTLTAWKTSDLLPQWTTVLLSQDQSATFSGAGELLNAQPERFDDELVYYIEREAGSIEMLTPVQFRTLVAEADREQLNRQSAR